MDISISFAKSEQQLALKRLFLNCFDDTLGFVNMLFSYHFVPENTIVALDGDRVVGEALMLPCTAEGKSCFYIYGVCVDNEYRGVGIGSRIVSFAKESAASRGGACLLHPENESLFGFYEKLGFSPCAYIKPEKITPTAQPVELLSVTAEEYTSLRDSLFAVHNPVCWDPGAVEYALTQETFFGGKYFKYKTENGYGIVLCGKDGGQTFIKETSASRKELDALCSAVIKTLGGEDVMVLLPGKKGDTVAALGAGFANDVYINLMLD